MIAIMPNPFEADSFNTLKRFSSDISDDCQQQQLNGPTSKRQRLGQDEHYFITHPHPHDVLCGRGGFVNKHAGNVVYRRVVEANKVTYHSCKKEHKLLLSQSIVEAIEQQNPPGRFVYQDKDAGLWYFIGKAKAVQKTAQALREGAEKIRSEIMETTYNSSDDNKITEASSESCKQSSRSRSSATISLIVPAKLGETDSETRTVQYRIENHSPIKDKDDVGTCMNELKLFREESMFDNLEKDPDLEAILMGLEPSDAYKAEPVATVEIARAKHNENTSDIPNNTEDLPLTDLAPSPTQTISKVSWYV
jgi:hypothetical protein